MVKLQRARWQEVTLFRVHNVKKFDCLKINNLHETQAGSGSIPSPASVFTNSLSSPCYSSTAALFQVTL